MIEPVAIVGIGMTKIEGNKVRDTVADMVYEAAVKALKDAEMEISDIENIVTTSNDFWDGRTISGMAVGDASGASDKNVSCVEGDGTYGAYYGIARTLSGVYDTTLVTAHSKGSEGVSHLITNAIFEPIYTRALGIDLIIACAMQARAYMEKYNISEEDFAAVSVKNHGNALKNPLAHLPMQISVQDVMASEMISDPLKKLDCSPVSDGAVALILARGPKADKCKNKVWIKGVSHCADAYQLGDRDLTQSQSLMNAAQKAYAMAGINNPVAEIDVAEIYDAFSYQELMWTEGLGFCEAGQGAKLLRDGVTAINGGLPVNPSGGLLSGHAVIAGGAYRLAEAALQVRGDAGEHQVGDVKTALAHGTNGACGQAHCVWILGDKP